MQHIYESLDFLSHADGSGMPPGVRPVVCSACNGTGMVFFSTALVFSLSITQRYPILADVSVSRV